MLAVAQEAVQAGVFRAFGWVGLGMVALFTVVFTVVSDGAKKMLLAPLRLVRREPGRHRGGRGGRGAA